MIDSAFALRTVEGFLRLNQPMTTNTDRIIRDAMIPGEASNGLCLAQLAELNCWSAGVTVTQRPGTPVPVVAYAGLWYVTNRVDNGPSCATAAEAIAAWNARLP